MQTHCRGVLIIFVFPPAAPKQTFQEYETNSCIVLCRLQAWHLKSDKISWISSVAFFCISFFHVVISILILFRELTRWRDSISRNFSYLKIICTNINLSSRFRFHRERKTHYFVYEKCGENLSAANMRHPKRFSARIACLGESNTTVEERKIWYLKITVVVIHPKVTPGVMKLVIRVFRCKKRQYNFAHRMVTKLKWRKMSLKADGNFSTSLPPRHHHPSTSSTPLPTTPLPPTRSPIRYWPYFNYSVQPVIAFTLKNFYSIKFSV